jgi:hypothetical protein
MRHLRLAATALALLAVAGTAIAGAATRSNAPTNLRGFLLSPNEQTTHTFARTPSFVWSPVRGARCYEFELGTSRSFTENSLIWSNVNYNVGRHSTCTAMRIGDDASSSSGSGSSSGSSGSGSSGQQQQQSPRCPT